MKNYIKPAIAFQSLAMTTSVSGGCAHKATSAELSCPIKVPGFGEMTIFQENTGCTAYFPDLVGSICYHVPTADQNVFES